MPGEIKICGLRELGDVQAVNRYRPDYIGLVMAPSPRRVSVGKAEELIRELHPSIKVVLVLVNMELEEAGKIREKLQPDILQLHGDETSEYMKKLGGKIWKTVSPGTDKEHLREILRYSQKVVMDSGGGKVRGGTGKTFDWSIISPVFPKNRLVLAGGINTENIREALKEIRPGCIDVSSGAEDETGKRKDPEKVRKLIEEVRKWG